MRHQCFNCMKFHLCCFIFLATFALHLDRGSSATNETDKLSLLAFRAAITEDPFGVLRSWNDTVHLCKWYGVACSLRHQRVTGLDLQSKNLSGSISPHIGNLSFLRELNLSNNNFGGEIPTQAGQLGRLRIFFVENNSLAGEIPKNLSSCSSLTYLSLFGNQLTGRIPIELGLLSKLQLLLVSFNNLMGNIPASLGNLSSLEQLYLARNNLSGSIPEALGNLIRIREFALGENWLSGSIPRAILNCSSLALLDVVENQLQGSLPADIGFTLPNLDTFTISFNQFTGPIPPSISNATNLVEFEISVNNLSGGVPSLENLHKLQWFLFTANHLGSGGRHDLSFLCSLGNATGLEWLRIDDNSFGGIMPDCLSNFSTTLTELNTGGNPTFGEMPREIGNLVNLGSLYMHSNGLSGDVPFNIGNLRNLVELGLENNKLSGVIPSSLGYLEKLTRAYLHGNSFEGTIPSNLSKCQNLIDLDLSDNNLSGTIPPEVIGLSSLSILLNLSRNHLTGVLPFEVGNLKLLASLDVSGNVLRDKIPASLGNCEGLLVLKMQDNFFNGSIPQSISSLRGIEELDLSHNNLSGEIPKFLEAFDFLRNLNLSYNEFEGTLPIKGIFKNMSATFVIGNDKLCGGMPEFQLPECSFGDSQTKKFVRKLQLPIFIFLGFLGVVLVLASLYLYRLKRKRKESVSTSSLNVSYRTIVQATDNFSLEKLIGVGGFGSVYKGILHENGNIVAIKVLNLLHHGALKSFIDECEAFRNIRHRNLLKILTVCSGIDYQGNDFKALVYEYMVNGSLVDWLHRQDEGNGYTKKLNFVQRINVAIDVASALDYLHHQCQRPMVHCDLKPSNVLLDAKMVGHVGDFGLAKFLLNTSSNASANQMSSAGVRGTVGYAAPEYAMGSDVSREGDVYSYGVLLLEMFTGLSPTNEMFKDNYSIRNFVAEAVPGRVLEITDDILLQERESCMSPGGPLYGHCRTKDIIQESLATLYEIGLACSIVAPRERVSITEVAVQLRLIRNKLYASGFHG
ncbi:probable LRR receptor-like serine/threonine-protein kinase At3g47570 [Eucalyptus grandis]|uniref:probable LRR receptor-like serine/threonine-protein kinase At3g47570 n=1 Tax=Eucalyptus grandis TaxID=71139 RepID=UPI00192E8592|nr:probable LRR receptor-like serine/threonine-protein kinase At3g47570 [Eucalyptus grandis]